MGMNKEFLGKFKELAKNTKILMVPSPYRIEQIGLTTFESVNFEVANYYKKWLESGKNLEEYYQHQDKGFPLFKL